MVILVVVIQFAMVNATMFVEDVAALALVGKICRTKALTIEENLICIAIGFSSLIIAAIVRATPEELLNKINITVINEDKVVSEDDPIMNALKGDSGAHKSSTARLLEEWK